MFGLVASVSAPKHEVSIENMYREILGFKKINFEIILVVGTP